MSLTKAQPKAGDPCPQCNGEFRLRRPATPEEYAASIHRENQATLPANVDGADPKHIEELGQLFVCKDCGYKTRIPPTLQEQADTERATAAKSKAKARTGTNAD